MSVFSDKPSKDWVACNRHAFAIRDGSPVSPGHTLVITRRETPTWGDATHYEHVALVLLVDDVIDGLKEMDPAPDGFNVGWNTGAAAGQTVQHLHVHVIPRYAGDVDDPRGGVRHVIPAKGNYTRDEQQKKEQA